MGFKNIMQKRKTNKQLRKSSKAVSLNLKSRFSGGAKRLAPLKKRGVKGIRATPKGSRKRSEWGIMFDTVKKYLGKAVRFIPNIIPYLSEASVSLHSSTHTKILKVPNSGNGQANISQSLNLLTGGYPRFWSEGERVCLCHKGLLTKVSLTDGTLSGNVLCRFDLEPGLTSWLSRMANFEKYRFRRIAIVYTPTCPATTTGALTGYFEWDVDSLDNPLTLESAIDVASSHASAATVDVWGKHVWLFSGQDEPHELYYVDRRGHEARLTTQGVFTLLSTEDSSANVDVGLLEIVYEIEFLVAEISSMPSGTYTAVDSLGTGQTAALPFGNAVAYLGRSFDNAIGEKEQVYANTSVRYIADTNSWLSIPEGFWSVTLSFTGVDLAGLLVGLYGGYAAIVDWTDTSAIESASNGGTAWVYSILLFSSGVAVGMEKGIQVLFSSATSVDRARATICYLNGSASYIDPLASQVTTLTKQVQQLLKEEKERYEKQKQPEPYRPQLVRRSSTQRNHI